MKDFEYFAPKTVEESLSLLSQYKEEAKILAGGQSMLVVMRQGLLSPEYVVDIKGISSLDYITYDGTEGLRIGALTTHRKIEKSPVIQKHFGALSEMERTLATIQTRNWGTLGGNLCHGDPAGDPAAVLIALGAKLKLKGPNGERFVSMEEFSKDMLEVDLEADEMLIEVHVPAPRPHTGVAYEKLTAIHGDSGIVGAAASVTLKSGSDVCEDVRIILSNAASVPLRVKDAESVLAGKAINESLLEEACEVASRKADPPSDVHGTAEYRREMVKVFVKRAALKALERARA